ncbi:hypothetical protein CEXT_359601 [Caerostris extrusa]|uniref:Uncharacterized protein n=1 Tax=Caerostris extrusa TaxID=172846 RepID=A0AAV4UJL8_CAEEX|nr:hypothetical protein CEXT_359601 [Caerostris extrusa]
MSTQPPVCHSTPEEYIRGQVLQIRMGVGPITSLCKSQCSSCMLLEVAKTSIQCPRYSQTLCPWRLYHGTGPPDWMSSWPQFTKSSRADWPWRLYHETGTQIGIERPDWTGPPNP